MTIDKVYAHTDKVGGRTASIKLPDEELGAEVWEQWVPFPRGTAAIVIALCEAQAGRLFQDAADLQRQLEEAGEGDPPG